MSRAIQSQEPSMEEILASIRRIMADDPSGTAQRPTASDMAEAPQGRPSAADVGPVESSAPGDFGALSAPGDESSMPTTSSDDVLELTDAMLAPEPEPSPRIPMRPRLVEPSSPESPFTAPKAPPAQPPLLDDRRSRRSEAGGDKAAKRPEPITDAGRLLSSHADAAVSGAFSNLASLMLSRDARTLEDLVSDILRPLLKAWLDDNLPALVERLVREEIERVSRGRR